MTDWKNIVLYRFPLHSANKMKYLLLIIRLPVDLRIRYEKYFLSYAGTEKTYGGVLSVINGMYRELAPHVTDSEHEELLGKEESFIRALVKDPADVCFVISMLDFLRSN